ncbi:MAG: AGE family epimerase/isomerase [Ornithinimicrobium sp.]
MAPSARWLDQPDHLDWLGEQLRRQLTFAREFPHPDGGAAYLDSDGSPDLTQPVHTWVTARMAHVYSLGHLAGSAIALPLATAAIDGLRGRLRDPVHGGWYGSVGPGRRVDEEKACYPHAFVVFAASSATVAGVSGAPELLTDALAVLDERFWQDEYGMHADSSNRDFSQRYSYRGVNANMHAVEALTSAADATGDERWRERAVRITTNVLLWASEHEWRIPEHFDEQWRPLLEHHREQPDDPFEPYGATVGHGLEWARLALHLHAAQGDQPATELLEGAKALFARAVEDGWNADGAAGFVYTTDWSGAPVVRQRMHWVVAEGISATAALGAATGEPQYEQWYRTWWDYARRYLIAEDGSWQHELDPSNEPAETVWPGRPDLYHSVHAVLLGRLPLAPSAATALGALRSAPVPMQHRPDQPSG